MMIIASGIEHLVIKLACTFVVTYVVKR